ncbi:MAG: MFS transporter [Deltaproteobacteria bacterium]|nr:MFS transporter [Deltaproteobacteria bacterium]
MTLFSDRVRGERSLRSPLRPEGGAQGDCVSEAIHDISRKRIKHPRESETWLQFIMLVVSVVPLSLLAADQWEKEYPLNDHTEPSAGSLPAFLGNGLSFLKRQHRDWKITVLRSSLDRLAYQMVFPYLSIYIVALGATGTQLGIVNSIGMVIAGLCGPFTGWFIDRIGPRPGAKLGGDHHRDDCLLAGFLHQHPQLRNHLRQLPGQSGPGHRHDDL